ncbi:EAL domain-containing protein [Psychrosphaera aestuarii]|uniref:EAL domain-containing protein n=1 Tax=Psychrosphaera aestuarii TaxID=1266052 RepID=UPI001B325549|nr:EAL domain-containing protein [Psychrosphaera aestuarii]
MQLTKVLYRGLMSSAGYIILSLFIFTNSVLFIALNSVYQSNIKQQLALLSASTQISNSVLPSPTNKTTLQNQVAKLTNQSDFIISSLVRDKSEAYAASMDSKFNSTSLLIIGENYNLEVQFRSFWRIHLKTFLGYNFLYGLICILSIMFTQRRLFKHWKILIQLEMWASRQAKDDNFKFFISSEKYHLVNTIRKLNNQRIEAKKSGQEIDHLIRSQAFLDQVTGLGNRRYFDNRLEALLQEEGEVRGAVFFINFATLDKLKNLQGKKATAYYVKNYANLLIPYLDDTQQSIVARLTYSEFAILIPFVDAKIVEKVASELIDKSQRLALPFGLDQTTSCYIGVKMFDQTETSFHILAETDLALRAAQLQGPSSWFMYEANYLPESEVKGSVRWRISLEKALKSRHFLLDLKPVNTFTGKVEQFDATLKMIDEQQNLIAACIFMPMARKSGMIAEIDKLALELALEELAQLETTPISVRLHIDSLLNRDFDLWLVRFLKQNSTMMPRVIIEISEFELTNNVKQIRQLLKIVKRYNGNVMVSQVGLYVVDLSYLNLLSVDSLKLHPSISGLLQNKYENQLFIKSLVGVANTQKQKVIATGIESESQIKKLKHLGVDCFQRN